VGHVELALEEVRLEDHDNKDDPIHAIRTWPRTRSGKDLHGERHDSAIVKKRNDKDHEGWELEPIQGHWHGKADNNTDLNSTGVNVVVPQGLGYNARTAETADNIGNGREAKFHQDDISHTTSSVRGTLDGDTHISTQEGRGMVCLSPVMAHGLVRTQDSDTCKLLNGGDMGDDSPEQHAPTCHNHHVHHVC